jgi:hypothetical protein
VTASIRVKFKGLQIITLSSFPQAVYALRTYHALNLATGNATDVKGKVIPFHTWRGPEGSRKLRLPDFKTIGT